MPPSLLLYVCPKSVCTILVFLVQLGFGVVFFFSFGVSCIFITSSSFQITIHEYDIHVVYLVRSGILMIFESSHSRHNFSSNPKIHFKFIFSDLRSVSLNLFESKIQSKLIFSLNSYFRI